MNKALIWEFMDYLGNSYTKDGAGQLGGQKSNVRNVLMVDIGIVFRWL